MQSCSVHHCILFFLILTVTTALVSAAICSTTAKLHQPVTLSCKHMCSNSLKWALYDNRDIVLAQCNQTSCSSEEGYEISHAKYQKGDLSLTITAADYSMRNTYACECGISDISTVRLSIETVISAVQKSSGEDLIMNLTITEPVQVLFKSISSASDEHLCNVTNNITQCKDIYEHRISLSYTELKLRSVTITDSGSYTIRDMKNMEDIHVYSVSVTDQFQFPWWGILLIVIILLLVVLLTSGLVVYRKKSRTYLDFKKVCDEQQHVNQLVEKAQTRSCRDSEAWTEAEMAMEGLEEQYGNNPQFSEEINLFCQAKRAQLRQCTGGDEEEMTERLGIIRKMERLIQSLQQLDSDGTGHPQAMNSNNTAEMEEDLTKIEEWCRENSLNNSSTVKDKLITHLGEMRQWCSEKRQKLWELQQIGGVV